MADSRNLSELLRDRRPGWSLEQRFYTDPAIYEREVACIINRNWVLAGHSSELPQPGDFKVFKVGKESAIIVRTARGELKAHANVCRHRGSLVCLQQSGNTRKFECPYHGWMYDTDGALLAARSMPEDFDKGSFGLHPVSLEVLGGLLFVCFADKPPSLSDARRDLELPFGMFGFESLQVAATRNYDIAANWKLAIENYQECYHCATAHPEYARMHTLMLDPAKRPRVQDAMRQRMPACGLTEYRIDSIDTLATRGQQGYGYSRTALFDGYLTGSRDGRPVAPLLGDLKDYDGGASDFTVGPFSYLLAYSDHVVAYVFTPVDAGHSRCDIYWLVRGDAEAGKDYDVAELTWLWDITTEADKRIIANNWAGVQSQYYRPGPFSAYEQMQSRYIDWIVEQLKEAC
ncbi:MAG: aromatic ring-hydroxylating dioxygenase subunit alpha [Woeseia sp.]